MAGMVHHFQEGGGGGPAWQWTEKSPDSHVEL